MTVLMTLRVKGDGAKLEALAARNPTVFAEILEKARRHGVISHRFYASDEDLVVIDEWPNPEAFQRFHEEAGSQIGQLMGEAGVRSEPVITFLRKLETGDDVG
jgi:hypothetical protein